MPEETQTTEKPAQAATEEQFPKSWEDVFKHPRFKELNTRAQTAEQRLKDIEAKEKDANDAALKEQNRWKDLYDGKEKELSQKNVELLRLRTLTAKILPDDAKEYLTLNDRLRGDTAEEIEKDADSLLALVKPASKSSGLPRARGNGSASVIDLTTETDPAKIREAYRQGNK